MCGKIQKMRMIRLQPSGYNSPIQKLKSENHILMLHIISGFNGNATDATFMYF